MQTEVKTITKSIISWVGGKTRLMWLINLLAPPRYERTMILPPSHRLTQWGRPGEILGEVKCL